MKSFKITTRFYSEGTVNKIQVNERTKFTEIIVNSRIIRRSHEKN